MLSLDFNLASEETYADKENPKLRRLKSNDSLVVWHNKFRKRESFKSCQRRIVDSSTVLFDSFGNPWCPTCYKENDLNGKVDRLGGYKSG
jgi:thiol-disulfide isomerase/thioredoxin